MENLSEWKFNEYGLRYCTYTINNIPCVLWSIDDQFILEYGNQPYYVNEYGEVYTMDLDVDIFIGMLTEEGYIDENL